MKQIFTFVLTLCLFAAYSQSNLGSNGKIAHQMFSNKTPDQQSLAIFKNRLPKYAPDSRAQNLNFYIDHGVLDQEYAANVTFGDYYEDAIIQINRRPPLDSQGIYKWAFTWYPRIIDMVNNSTWPFTEYPANQIQMTIDTVFLGLGHIRNSTSNDTIQVSVWDLDAMQTINFADSACTGVLYGRITTVLDSSLTGAGTQPGTINVVTYPFVPAAPIVIPQGKRFIIQVDFFGPNNDEFYLITGRRNDCGNATCGASKPYIEDTYNASVDSFNSLAGIRYVDVTTPANSGIYPSTLFFNDCNNNQQQDTDPAYCERLFLQDLAIYPNIAAVIPNFYADLTASATAACPSENITLTAAAGGSSNPNYTYSWTTTGGNLSSLSDPSVTLTTGNTTDTVIVVVTDGNNQTTSDTIIIASRAIGIVFTSANPLSINCGATGSITTQLSGNTTGRIYTWSTGVTPGPNIPAQTVNAPGTYTVTITNSFGCSATASTQVVYPSVTNTASFTYSTPVCVGTPVTFTNTSTSTNNWGAQWDVLGNGTTFALGVNGIGTYTYTNPGQFSVDMTTDSAGCTFVSAVQVINVLPAASCTGIESADFSNGINMLPNPTNGNVSITVNGVEKNLSIRVYNVIGAEVKNFNANDVASSFTKNFDFSGLSNGTYLVKIQTGTKVAVKRLIISK